MNSAAVSGGKPVRVRFAPSPTGYLHIGGVRTALFNWLWARRQGGTFVLRIEDTDQERSTPENERVILESLRWLGMDWDEGPEVGGSHGPYRQMERLPIYQEFVQKLLDNKSAYRCYCTKEDLDRAREELKAKDPKAQFRYPGTCWERSGPAPDRPFSVRFRAPREGSVSYRDLVFGEVTTPNTAQQDAVIMRSDGVPLYNLGSVVDDITMGMTLVARGRDHMINTPPQILLYQALGYDAPDFAHLPMMLAPDGAKLSKRHGAVSVGDYQERGIPPHALLNYLVRFGWSFGDEEIFSLKDLSEKFGWERCGKGDGKFDAKKLAAISFEHLKAPALISDDDYAAEVGRFLQKRGLEVAVADIVRALPLYRERGESFVHAAELMDYLFRPEPVFDEKAQKKFLIAERAEVLDAVAGVLQDAAEWATPALDARFQAFLTERSLEMKHVAQPMRVALTGRSASPGLFEVAELLGKDRTVARLRAAANLARSNAGPQA